MARKSTVKALAVGIGVATLLLLPHEAVQAQGNTTLLACKQLTFRQTMGGSSLGTKDCGNQFTTDDPYIGLVIQFADLRDDVDVAILLIDPEQTNVVATRTTIKVDPSIRYSTYQIYLVLPIAADANALAMEARQLADAMIRLRGKPARDRLGQWTLSVALGRGQPKLLKFVLGAAPSPASTPTSTPTPTP
jgi:hypothetical protein